MLDYVEEHTETEKAHLSYVQHICIAEQGHWDVNFLILTPVTSGGHLMRRVERKPAPKYTT